LEDGIYYKDTLKYASDERYYVYTEKTGKLYSEVCQYNGVRIEHLVYDETCGLYLEPLNSPEYKRAKAQKEKPVQEQPSGKYERCLYFAALFEKMFKVNARSDIDLDLPDSLRALLYGELGLPVIIREKGGAASVETKAIRKLAGIKSDNPAIALSEDITDKNGRLILRAEYINTAKYPAAVYLDKYRYYKKKSEKLQKRR
jgi:hypothetical protein